MHRTLLLAVLALFACKAAAPQAPSGPLIVDHSRPMKKLGDLPPVEAAAAVESVYRLAPDRRFLLAVRDIYQLQTGRAATVDIDFKDGSWLVRCDGRDAGRLPLTPTFADGYAMLTSWSKSLGAMPRKSGKGTADDFFAQSLFKDANDYSIATAARAAVYLDVQLVDVFELGDPVTARALALLAMARNADPHFGNDEKALLANAMRYESEAAQLAQAAPRGSAARIATGVEPPNVYAKEPLIAYVSACRVLASAPRMHRELVAPALGEQNVHALPLLMRSDDLIEASEVAHGVERLLNREVTGDALHGHVRLGGVPDWIDTIRQMLKGDQPGARTAAYEAAIGEYSSRLASPLLDATVVRAWYDALYYTSLERQLRFGSDHLGSESATSDFLRQLGTTESQPGHDVREVMAVIDGTKFGSAKGVPASQLIAARHIGGTLRADLYVDLCRMHGETKADLDAEPAVLAMLDSRPAQRFEAGVVAVMVTGDPLRREVNLRSALDAAPRAGKPGYLGYFASILGDTDRMKQIMDRDDLSPYERALAAKYLAGAGDRADSDRGFEKLFRESDYSDFYSVWAGVVNERHDWAAKERAARGWLDKHRDRDIEHAYYAASLADALEEQGRYDEAWAIIEPDMQAWSANVIGQAVSLLQRRGHVKESDELAARMIERYPGAWTRGGYAVVLWRQKRWNEGAALFGPKSAAYSASEFDEHVPQAMTELLAHATPADVAAAAGALADAGVPPDRLNHITQEFLKQGHADLAFAAANEFCKRYPLKNEVTAADEYCETYRALAAWKGRPAATAWLRERLSNDDALQVISLLYQGHDDEAVLDFADYATRVRTDELQLLVAAAMTRLRLPDSDPRVVALKKEIAAQTYDPKSLQAITRYLLGITDEKQFAAWGNDASDRVSVLYAIGLKSAAAGDYDRALPYFLAARHGAFDTPPQAWAVEALNRWNHERGTWREIIRKRIL